MNLPTEIFGDVVVVHTPDELGEDQAEPFTDYMMTLDRSKIVVDVDGTESFDSAGLESLLNAQAEMRGAAGDVKVASTNATNRKILEITQLDKQLEVFDSVIEAVKSFAG